MARILIVEDNVDLLTILRELLGQEHEVLTTRRGEDAVVEARSFDPDLVILDLQLPTMDGIETGRWIKRELGSGCCDAYLPKPATIDSIRARVSELLEGGAA